MKPPDATPDWVPKWIQVEGAKRDEVKARYGALFQQIAIILFETDPIGINFEDNTDEYEAEVGTILPRLETCQTPESVCVVVHQEFVRWFGPEIAGSEVRYQPTARRIWDAWNLYKDRHAV